MIVDGDLLLSLINNNRDFTNFTRQLFMSYVESCRVDIKSPEEIKRAIKYFEKEAIAGDMLAHEVVELLRLIIGQEQKRKYWDEEQIFGKPR